VGGVEPAGAEADALDVANLDGGGGGGGVGGGVRAAGHGREEWAEDVGEAALKVEEEQAAGDARGAVGDAHQAGAAADGDAVRGAELGGGRLAAGGEDADRVPAGGEDLDPAIGVEGE
jgi:hypothetical protein